MFLAEWTLGEALVTVLWITMWMIWFWIVISIFMDLFRDHTESGVKKALWALFIIAIPFLGVLVYLIVRGQGMAQRNIDAMQKNQQAFDQYVRQTAGNGSPTEQIAHAKELLDAGTIDQGEFDKLKAKALN